jgi:membrane-associated protease RseP (regulator of RpoE activity)
MIHYPYLFAGYLALFFTALNLLPIGQLDGGHVLFGLFPRRHAQISLVVFTLFLAFAGLGVIRPSIPIEELLIRIPLYLGFLYFCLSKSGLTPLNRLTIALSLAAGQYLLSFFYPTLEVKIP